MYFYNSISMLYGVLLILIFSPLNDMSHQGYLVFVDIIIIPSQHGSVPSRHDFWLFSCSGFWNPESGFLSGSPVFQKVHIWNLHAMGSFRMQKFFRTKFVWDPVLLRNDGFLTFFSIHHIYAYKTSRK